MLFKKNTLKEKQKVRRVEKNAIEKGLAKNHKTSKKITRRKIANKASAIKFSWKFKKKKSKGWTRVRKKNHKKKGKLKKTNNTTGNRTSGLHWNFGYPSSPIIYIRSQPEFRSSNKRHPTLVKLTTEKKTWLNIDLTLSHLKKTLLYVRLPNSSSKIPIELRFHQNKNVWGEEKGNN